MPSSVAYSETRTLANDHNARALNGSYRLGREALEMPSRPDEARKNEDIFLNIARTDSDRRDSLGRSDFRRVSFSPLTSELWFALLLLLLVVASIQPHSLGTR